MKNYLCSLKGHFSLPPCSVDLCEMDLLRKHVSMLWIWTERIMYLWFLAGQCSNINGAFWKKSLGSLSGPVVLLQWWTSVDQLLCKHSLPSSYLLKKLSNVFCLMSSVWLQAGPSERWIYDKWGQSCVWGKCWCYQNLIIPCNGEAVHCAACINL